MAYIYVVGKNYNTRADFLSDLWTQLTNMGWALHDDQSASGYRVYKSNGELGDRIYEYIKIDYSTANTIRFLAFAWWNTSTHSGFGAYQSNNTPITTSESGFQAWIYGNKNLVLIASKVSGTYYRTLFGHFNKKLLTVEATLQANVTSGSNVTITVDTTNGFVAGNSYQIFGSQGEGRDVVTVSSIPDSTHLVISSLPRNYNAGAKIGQAPSIFGHLYGSYFYITNYWTVSGTSNGDTPSYLWFNLVAGGLFSAGYVNPNIRDNLYWLQPLIGYENQSSGDGLSVIAINDEYILQAPNGNNEDVFVVNRLNFGTAEGGTSTTLTDNDKSWATDQWVGKVLVISAGTGVGQVRKIIANTDTTITVDNAFLIIPDSTSQYIICDEAYRCLNNTIPYFVAREGI
jgi:hypothetical protein